MSACEAASATENPVWSPLNARNSQGMMPVHQAVCQGNTAFVAALLAAGAGPTHTQIAALHRAASCFSGGLLQNGTSIGLPSPPTLA